MATSSGSGKAATLRRTVLDEQRQAVANYLQPQLLELIDLGLQAKQAHWNVVGSRFRSVRRPLLFAIPKAGSPEHAAENAGVGQLMLTEAELARIDGLPARSPSPRAPHAVDEQGLRPARGRSMDRHRDVHGGADAVGRRMRRANIRSQDYGLLRGLDPGR